jgi:hypothetical protein
MAVSLVLQRPFPQLPARQRFTFFSSQKSPFSPMTILTGHFLDLILASLQFNLPSRITSLKRRKMWSMAPVEGVETPDWLARKRYFKPETIHQPFNFVFFTIYPYIQFYWRARSLPRSNPSPSLPSSPWPK